MSTTITPRCGDVVTLTSRPDGARATVVRVTDVDRLGIMPATVTVRVWGNGREVSLRSDHMHVVRRRRYSPALDVMVDGWDGGDVWGSAMSMAWAVAEVARSVGEPTAEDVRGVLEVSWGAAAPVDVYVIAEQVNAGEVDDLDVDYTTAMLAAAYVQGDVTADDLTFAGRVLSRYLDLCKAAGLDY